MFSSLFISAYSNYLSKKSMSDAPTNLKSPIPDLIVDEDSREPFLEYSVEEVDTDLHYAARTIQRAVNAINSMRFGLNLDDNAPKPLEQSLSHLSSIGESLIFIFKQPQTMITELELSLGQLADDFENVVNKIKKLQTHEEEQ